MTTYIALTDDWELRGNGTGRVENLQRKPAIELMDLYDRFDIKSTFNVEVMQQLAFERYVDVDKDIESGRDAWRETVRLMIARGFDVQLHIHPQWMNAKLIDGWWKLDRRWNIADYSAEEICRMLDAAIPYLEALIAPHRIVSFRGGSWGMGPPSRTIISELSRRGIRIDVSIVKGSLYDGEAIRLDYRHLDSPFFPYRPDTDDIRRRSLAPANAAPLIEVPTQSVERGLLMAKMLSKLSSNGPAETLRATLSLVRGTQAYSRASRVARALFGRSLGDRSGKRQPDFVILDPFGFQSGRGMTDVIFDLSSDMPLSVFCGMADVCIARSANDPNPVKVLILENHTKDLQRPGDFGRIAGLIEYIRLKYPHVEFRPLSQLADKLVLA